MGAARAAARTRGWVRSGSLIIAFGLFAAPAQAAPELVKAGDFASPTYVTAAPGDASRLFVTERGGRVRLIRDGTVVAQPFLDLSSITSTDGRERGLLSAAFAPDYASSGRFYVYLTATAAAATTGTIGELQVREYTRSAADPDVADPASARMLLSVRHDMATNHNGGQLQFGPDGKLWLATGDGANGANAQDPGSLLGKLIRLDPAAPSPEVLARGLRNPWRFSFDRANGQLVIADVGESEVEEINLGLAANYGWPCFEGHIRRVNNPACDSGTAEPAVEKTHMGDGFCAITGGYVVRDPGLPTLAGRYLYGDNCVPALRSVDIVGGAGDVAVGLAVPSLSSFGEDACGRLLAVSLDGPVYRIVDGAPSACASTAPPARVTPTPADARACKLSARVTGLRSVRRLRRLTVALRADEACRATVSARIRGVATFRSATYSLVPGRRHVIRLRLTARGAQAVRRAVPRPGTLRVALRVQALDATGNTATLTRSARVSG